MEEIGEGLRIVYGEGICSVLKLHLGTKIQPSVWARNLPNPAEPRFETVTGTARAASPGLQHQSRALVPERTVDGSKLHNLGQSKLSKGRFITLQDYRRKRPLVWVGLGNFPFNNRP